MRPQDEACEALCCIPPSFPSVTPCDKAEPQKGGCQIKSGQPSLTDLGEAIRETGMVRGERVGAAGHCLLYSRQEDQSCSEYLEWIPLSPIIPGIQKVHSVPDTKCHYENLTKLQGLVCARDGYTQRMDLVFGDLPNSERCVDDTVIWDDDIESNFLRSCLTKCSLYGCAFNGSKF